MATLLSFHALIIEDETLNYYMIDKFLVFGIFLLFYVPSKTRIILPMIGFRLVNK